MTWMTYVQQQSGTDNATQIGARVGVTASSVLRWDKSEPKPEQVRSFAIAYGRPVLEAFVAAGFLSAEDAGQQLVRQDVAALTDEQLVSEVLARMKERYAQEITESQQGQGSTPGRSRRRSKPPIVPTAEALSQAYRDEESLSVDPHSRVGEHP